MKLSCLWTIYLLLTNLVYLSWLAKVDAVTMQMSGCSTPRFSPLDTPLPVPVSEKLLHEVILWNKNLPWVPWLILKAQRSSLLNTFRKGPVVGQAVSHPGNECKSPGGVLNNGGMQRIAEAQHLWALGGGRARPCPDSLLYSRLRVFPKEAKMLKSLAKKNP